MEDSSGRLVSKTPFINIIKDAYGTLMWKTHLEHGLEYFYRRLISDTYVD